MNEEEIAKEIKAIRDRLDKIESFLNTGLHGVINKKVSSDFKQFSEIIDMKINALEKRLKGKD